MNTQIQHLNAAAIDRLNLIKRVRAAQASLSDHALARFDRFAEIQAGALHEFTSDEALERAFIRFEWVEVDRLYTSMFLRLLAIDGVGDKTVGALYREVPAIIRDKLRRHVAKYASLLLRGVAKIAWPVFLALLFVTVSEVTSEAVLYYVH